MTIGDLVIGLENLKRERKKGVVDEISYEGLRRTIGKVLKRDDIRLFGEIEKIDDLIQELGLWPGETTIETVVEKTPEAGEVEMESKAVDPYVLQQLLRDLDEHEAKLELGKEAERLANKYNVPVQTVEDLIARKMELLERKKAEILREDPKIDPAEAEVMANELSNAEMVMKAEAVKAGWPEERVSQIERLGGTVEKLGELKMGTEEQELMEEIARETEIRVRVKIKTIEARRQLEEEMGTEIDEEQRRQVDEILAKAMGKESPGMAEIEISKIIEMPQSPAVRRAVGQMVKFGEENPEVAREYELTEQRKEIVAEFERANPTMNEKQREAVVGYVEVYIGWQRQISPVRISAEGVERARVAEESVIGGEQPTGTQIGQGLPKVEVLAEVTKTPTGAYQNILKIRKRLKEVGVEMPTTFKKCIKFEAFERINELVEKNQIIRKILFFAQKREALEMAVRTGVRVTVVNTLFKVGAPVAAGKVLGWIGVETIGKWTAEGFARLSLRTMRMYGFEQGAGLMIKAVATRAAAKMTAGTVGKVALEGLIATLGGGIPGWVLTAVLIVGDVLWSIGKKVIGTLKVWMNELGLNVNMWGNFMKDLFGEKMGKVMSWAVPIGGMVVLPLVFLFRGILAIPALLMTASTAVVGWVVAGVIIGPMVWGQLFQNPQVAMLVPPAMGGGCIKVEKMLEEGVANCARGLPEQSVEGVDRENYFRLADTWKDGKNHARECFDAVVCESKRAGINPAWALWAWLHESGASNYSDGEVEDFGVHISGVPKNNFQVQLEEFFKLDYGNSCPGVEYWLAFSSKYLNGSCNPEDKHITTDQTGRQYYEELLKTWEWMMGEGANLPRSIKVPASGGKCEGSMDASEDGVYITDETGQQWWCAEGSLFDRMGNVEIPPFNFDGEIPKGCPDRLPVNSRSFSQGPYAPNCSHEHMTSPAIDIAVPGGTSIVATHPGVVSFGHDDIYGYYVDVIGSECGALAVGETFVSRYAHMPSLPNMENGATVVAGEEIGVVDSTGNSTGDHIHYHVTGLDESRFGQYLGLDEKTTTQLWGCCGGWNLKQCPN